MKLINKLLYRRFSKEEHKQLREILTEESRALLKRPQYIIGNIIIAGLILHFVVKGLGHETFQWPKTGEIVGIVFGVSVGVLVLWLILTKLFKVKSFQARFVAAFWGLWMVCFGLLITTQPTSETKWNYVIYAAITFVGWLCCCQSIKEHLCERIFMSRKKPGSSALN